MTRMRTVGLFGTTTVVAGFLLTLWKIHRRRRFLWLVRRDLWAVASAVTLYAVTPVDWLIHKYNVQRVMAGDPAPVVEITEHPVSAEGLLVLEPLLDCDDPIIQKGVAAMLTIEQQKLRSGRPGSSRAAKTDHWTTRQWSVDALRERLEDTAIRREALIESDEDISEVFQKFRTYAYQWY
jgi:hypothetical protein